MADQKLYNINDGVTGREGGPYLDEIQAREAEVRRAQVEGREPSEELQPYAGFQLVPGQILIQTQNTASLPSQEGNFALAQALDESKFGAVATTTVPEDLSNGQSEEQNTGTSSTSRRSS